MNNILITGSHGFVGTNLVQRLISLDYDLTLVDTKIGWWVEHLQERDLRGINTVIHLANTARIGPSWQHPDQYFQNNVVNTTRFFQLCQLANVKRFFYVSSSSVYGAGSKFQTERTQTNPSNPYALSKITAERTLRMMEGSGSTRLTVIRPFTMYGPHMPLKENALVIGKFINCVLNDLPLVIEGSGKQKRDFIHVDDFVDAVLLLLNNDTEHDTFNIGSGTSTSILELAQQFDHEIIYTMPRPNDAYDTCAICDRISALGFEPKVNLANWIIEQKQNNFKEYSCL